MSANTHWTRSQPVAAEGGSAENPSREQGSMADPPVRPEHDRGRSPTPSSDHYDENEERGDDERALQQAERKALEEGAPLPTLTGTIRPRSDTSATIAPAPKRSRRNGSDSEDDNPKTYEGKNQGELDTFTLECEGVFRKRSSQYKKEWRRADYAKGWIKPELAKSWNLKVEQLGDDYRAWSNLKDYLQDDLRPKALRAKDACSKWLQASQHQNQTVTSFVNYIDQLEKDLPLIPEDMKRLRLMCAFRPDIELAIEQRADIPESREGLITLAINIERAHKGQRSANPSYAQPASGLQTGGSFKDKGKAQADHKAREETKPKEPQGGYEATPRVEKSTTTADGRPICFNCNEPGHISNHAQNRRRSEGKATVQVRNPTGWKTLTALIDSGANENFITHLRVAELGIKPRQEEATPRVTTIDETQLQVYGVYRLRIGATDNSGATGKSHSQLLAASFTGRDILLGWPWLKELNPDIDWRDERWSYRVDSEEKPMPQGASEERISFLDAQEFIDSSKDDVVHVMHLRPGREGPTEGQSRPWATHELPTQVFEKLKEAFTTAPILRHYDLVLPMRMVTDSSVFAIAATLSQLYVAERAAGLAEATHAVGGDGESPSTRIEKGVEERWTVAASILLAGTGGRTHQVQRHTVEETAEGEEAYSRPSEDFRKVLVDLQKEDPFKYGLGWNKDADGTLYHYQAIYVPALQSARTEVLRRNHDDPLAGHSNGEERLS
ncbi:MAG: hypothetical protein M1816_000713 [Peltula sp. TS41687]|nr:MAG: hypothetical protein M1816_000713 [Peltula sp. TS41687]